MRTIETKFCIGQVVIDPQFHFRGVIVDVDGEYLGTDAWYEKNVPHKAPKEEPWYHLLVHNSEFRAYTAESLLILDTSVEPIFHPEIDYFFNEFKDGLYKLRRRFDV